MVRTEQKRSERARRTRHVEDAKLITVEFPVLRVRRFGLPGLSQLIALVWVWVALHTTEKPLLKCLESVLQPLSEGLGTHFLRLRETLISPEQPEQFPTRLLTGMALYQIGTYVLRELEGMKFPARVTAYEPEDNTYEIEYTDDGNIEDCVEEDELSGDASISKHEMQELDELRTTRNKENTVENEGPLSPAPKVTIHGKGNNWEGGRLVSPALLRLSCA